MPCLLCVHVPVRFAVSVFKTLSMHYYLHHCIHACMLTKNAFVCAVYRKSLVMGPTALQEASVGKVTNLMSTDSERIRQALLVRCGSWDSCCCVVTPCCRALIHSCGCGLGWRMTQLFHHSYIQLFVIVGTIVALLSFIGPSAFAGIVLLAIVIPLQVCVRVCARTRSRFPHARGFNLAEAILTRRRCVFPDSSGQSPTRLSKAGDAGHRPTLEAGDGSASRHSRPEIVRPCALRWITVCMCAHVLRAPSSSSHLSGLLLSLSLALLLLLLLKRHVAAPQIRVGNMLHHWRANRSGCGVEGHVQVHAHSCRQCRTDAKHPHTGGTCDVHCVRGSKQAVVCLVGRENQSD